MGRRAIERPIVSQIVIDEFANIVDSQDEKGIKKYGRTIDDADDENYNWEIMALEETADLQKYLVRQIQMLKKQNKELKSGQRKQFLDKVLKENLELAEENNRLKEALNGSTVITNQASKIIKSSISNFCKQAYETAKSKGWHDDERETGTLLALIHSEVSEALEADRRGWKDNFAEELADICIRVFDLCGYQGIDLEKAILTKMEFNKTRPHMHGGKRY